uniref:Uncharacterized protein n=1 Tax=Elizabethkingia anophelis TaxID=1117645 RepID=A0A455ZHL7_9FLAO|nr:TPA_exp: hypothetical protein [Elizabethkingia anophelis]DAC76278.1 TPA_exp: hypothetical protein [Elizabethkingia anophelis]
MKAKYSNATLVISGHDEWTGGGHIENTITLLNKITLKR